LTPELLTEGFVRELISKIQTMRKEAGFEVMDHIRVYSKGNEIIGTILKAHEEEVKSEVLADSIQYETTAGYEKEWNINGENVTLGVEKIQ
jgi:isoleucyl-tRNA synthetase